MAGERIFAEIIYFGVTIVYMVKRGQEGGVEGGVETPHWEQSLAEGLSSLLENNQVNAISFEGGALLSDENRDKILQRAEKIENRTEGGTA